MVIGAGRLEVLSVRAYLLTQHERQPTVGIHSTFHSYDVEHKNYTARILWSVALRSIMREPRYIHVELKFWICYTISHECRLSCDRGPLARLGPSALGGHTRPGDGTGIAADLSSGGPVLLLDGVSYTQTSKM